MNKNNESVATVMGLCTEKPKSNL